MQKEKSTMKAQAAIEFFIYATAFMIILLGSYFAVSAMQESEVYGKESRYVKEAGTQFSSSINAVMKAGPGFSYTIKFKKNIFGSPYSVIYKPASTGNNGFVFITWLVKNLTFTYPIGNMTIANSSCVVKHAVPATGDYYEINTTLGALYYYNNGSAITLRQEGC